MKKMIMELLQIFLDDSTKNIPRMIYAKNGVLIDNKKQKVFKLLMERYQ